MPGAVRMGLKAPTGPDPDDFVIVNFAESNLLRVPGYVAVSVATSCTCPGQFAFSQAAPQTRAHRRRRHGPGR